MSIVKERSVTTENGRLRNTDGRLGLVVMMTVRAAAQRRGAGRI